MRGGSSSSLSLASRVVLPRTTQTRVYTTRASSAPTGSVRVVTDIDDTVKSSGGVKLFGIALGGIDTQFKRGEFYPGVFQFAYELSKANAKRSSMPEKVAVLTARAKEFKFALAIKPSSKISVAFAEAGAKNGAKDWGIGNVYYGSVLEWIFQNRKGIRKFDNFEIMMRQDELSSKRKSQYILVGDTGEKDEEAGERIARKYGDSSLRAIFLHAVSEDKDRSTFKLPKDRDQSGVPIFYFRTYVGAATKAMKNKLISPDGLQRVVVQARADMAKKRPLLSDSACAEIEEDIRIALLERSKAMRNEIGFPSLTANFALTRERLTNQIQSAKLRR